MLIAQISDCHIMEPGEAFGGHLDSAVGLRATIDAINGLSRHPDMVLATGDLVNDGAAAQYGHLAAILTGLDIPLIPLVGNHDCRAEFRRCFDGSVPAGDPNDPLRYTIDDHAVRIVALDTSIPGRHDGELSADQLAWLDARLGEAPDHPTIVAQHHPPFASGIRWMDRDSGFASAAAERDVIARHDHVEAVVAGHLHRTIARRFAGTIAIACPSTVAALEFDLVSDDVAYSTEPTGFLLHEWTGEGLTTHVITVDGQSTWSPTWAV